MILQVIYHLGITLVTFIPGFWGWNFEKQVPKVLNVTISQNFVIGKTFCRIAQMSSFSLHTGFSQWQTWWHTRFLLIASNFAPNEIHQNCRDQLPAAKKKTGHRVGGTCWVGIWPGTPADQRVVEIGGGFLVKIERKRQKTNFWTKKGNLCSVGFSGAEFCPGEAQKTRRHLKWRPESQQHAHNLFGAQSSPQLEKRRFEAARPRNSPKTAQFWHGFRKSAISRAHVHEFFIWKLFWVSDFIRDHAQTIFPFFLVVTFSNLSTDLWQLIQGAS